MADGCAVKAINANLRKEARVDAISRNLVIFFQQLFFAPPTWPSSLPKAFSGLRQLGRHLSYRTI